jgi:hypothetical protein
LVSALNRWRHLPLDARFRRGPGTEDLNAKELHKELANRCRSVRATALKSAILSLGRQLADAEQRRDFSAMKTLFNERIQLQLSLRTLET